MEWNNLGKRTVYENRWVRVNMADVELPHGRHRLLLSVDPQPGISTSHHRVYWSDSAELVCTPSAKPWAKPKPPSADFCNPPSRQPPGAMDLAPL
ncbi:hypothetical protein [Streptomyces sp. NPDC048636]|uniref:hypothetical protein n=1 Tax=Streptomyces sp. NPDC048636 TaxID=3155762 RepID=UPI003448D223